MNNVNYAGGMFLAWKKDRPVGDQRDVYSELFIEQLHRREEGWYETRLLWKAGHAALPTNERGSIKILESLLKKLQREPGMMDRYDQVIQNQITQGIVEKIKCLMREP